MNWFSVLWIVLGIALIYMAVTGKYQLAWIHITSTPLTPASGATLGGAIQNPTAASQQAHKGK